MATTDLAARLTEMLEPIAESHGYELVAVEQAGGRHSPIIRILLDRDGGVDLEAITSASRWLGEFFDENDPISGPYSLEVSSPGVDRPLRKRSDYERFAGQTVTIKAKAEGSRGTWTGVLLGIEGDEVIVGTDGQHVRIKLDDIQKARLKGVVDFNERGTR